MNYPHTSPVRMRERLGGVIGIGLLAVALLTLYVVSPGARSTPSGAVPDPHSLERNNRGELSHWHHGNVIGRALIQYGDCLVAGGGFTHAGGVEAPGAAMWDGNNWNLASIEPLNNWVYALAEYGETLYAGGHFTQCGATALPYVARLDAGGSGSWEALGGPPLDGDVWALAAFDDGAQSSLVAGGGFTEAGGAVLNGVARWDGASWLPMGDGFSWEIEPGVFLPGMVYALYVFENQLYAGGAFTHSGASEVRHFAHWNGMSWEAVDGGFDAPVMAIGEFAGELVVGGHFIVAGDEVVFHVAHLGEGEWQPYYWGTNAAVFAITHHRDQLVVGGEFNEAGGLDCSYVAAWNGYDWLPLGAGLDDNRVFGLGLFAGDLFATGGFVTSHDVTVNRIAGWDPPHWFALGDGLEGYFIEPVAPDGQNPIRSLGGAAIAPSPPLGAAVRLAVRPQGNGQYQIRFALPATGRISLDLVDAAGRRVAHVDDGIRTAGEHAITWRPDVGTGVYFLRLAGDAGVYSSRLLVVE